MRPALDTTLILKLTLTPLFIAIVSGFGRRFGPRAGGWLAGLPLTSGPISVFLALEQGTEFAAKAAPATILGILPVAAFCLLWCRLARYGLARSYATAILAYLAIVPFLGQVTPSAWASLGLTTAAILVALLGIPLSGPLAPMGPPPRWDVALRTVVATSLVLLLTGVAHLLGPHLTGLLSPFPVFASVLAGFHHKHDGAEAAIAVLRGILTGVISFCAFFFVVATALPLLSLVAAYGIAAGAAVLLNGVNGILLRKSMPLRSPTRP